jgi:hypothetical protein
MHTQLLISFDWQALGTMVYGPTTCELAASAARFGAPEQLLVGYWQRSESSRPASPEQRRQQMIRETECFLSNPASRPWARLQLPR